MYDRRQQLSTRVHAVFSVDRSKMVLDSLHRDRQLVGDLLVGQTVDDTPEDIGFSRREVGHPFTRGRLAHGTIVAPDQFSNNATIGSPLKSPFWLLEGRRRIAPCPTARSQKLHGPNGHGKPISRHTSAACRPTGPARRAARRARFEGDCGTVSAPGRPRSVWGDCSNATSNQASFARHAAEAVAELEGMPACPTTRSRTRPSGVAP
jgi:hypothetical protein